MTATIAQRLAEPFDPEEVRFRAGKVSGNRALALAYIDARLVMDRLDEVVGIGNWQDSYSVLPSGEVQCQLSVRIDGEWITKEDVGGQSEQPDEGDRFKAAFSDALKRAAVKFGVGRYLYGLGLSWVDFDPNKRQLASKPKLPPWALPGHKPPPPDGALDKIRAQAEESLERAAENGTEALAALWKATPNAVRALIPAAEWQKIKDFAAQQDAIIGKGANHATAAK